MLLTAGIQHPPGLAFGNTGANIFDFFPIELQGRTLGECLELIESCACRQKTCITLCVDPLSHGSTQATVQSQVLTAFVEPVAETIPGAQERFVSNFDGWP